MDILSREKGQRKQKQTEEGGDEEKQEEDPECVDTKLHIWHKDEYEEIDVDYLNQVYPQKITKVTVQAGCQFIFHFLANSLNYWVQLKDPQEDQPNLNSTSNQHPKLSRKDLKYFQQMLSEEGCDNAVNYNRWGKHFNKSQQFYALMDKEDDFVIPEGGIKVHQYTRKPKAPENQENQETIPSKFGIYKYKGSNPAFIQYKHKFQILFLFFIDGVSFVQEQTDQWEYYLIFKEEANGQKIKYTFIGVLSKFIFKITTVRRRERISQVFIMPNHQNQGHGGQLIDYIYRECIQDPMCFEITTEVPSFEYQCLRDYRECVMLLNGILHYSGYIEYSQIPKCKSIYEIESAQSQLLNSHKIRRIKQQIKIPGNQIERLANLLIYAKIIEDEQTNPDCDMHKAIFQQHTRDRIIFNRSAFKSRKKLPHITFNDKTADMKDFFLQKSKQDLLRNQEQIQEILTETLDGFRRVIYKLRRSGILDSE